MDRFYIYHVSLLIVGAALGVPALASVITGEQSFLQLLWAVGGCGMMIAAVYELYTKDPAEFMVGKYTVWTIVVGALLTLLAGAIRLAS